MADRKIINIDDSVLIVKIKKDHSSAESNWTFIYGLKTALFKKKKDDN